MRIWSIPHVDFIPLDEIEEPDPVILVSTPGAWKGVAAELGQLQIARQMLVEQATIQHWIQLAGQLPPIIQQNPQVQIYAVGGGLAVDAAKYIANSLDRPLTCLPTALSADAFFTPESAVRIEGGVRYMETRPPERLLIDFDLLAAAPSHLRAAGICDLLSIATGLWDWEYAEEKGQNPDELELIPWAADAAQAILEGAIECAPAAGQGDPAGLKQLLDLLALEVQLCNQIGHSRPEEGSEHYFAYAAEQYLKKKLSHGELVGPGILLMAEFQEQERTELQSALEDCRIPLDHIPDDIIGLTLKNLPQYVRQHELPYGIAHELKF